MKSTTSFWLCTVFAFVAVICFVQIDSAAADKYNLNWLYITGGIITGAASVFFLAVTAINTRK